MDILLVFLEQLSHSYEQALCLLCNDHVQLFQGRLETTNEKTVHQKNLEYLAKDTYTFLKLFIFSHNEEIFKVRENIYKINIKKILKINLKK